MLGHIVDGDGIHDNPSTTSQVVGAPVPTTKTELRSFLGLASCYRRFMKDFAKIAAPLHAATTPKWKFQWDGEMQEAFIELKKKLCSPPVLTYPEFNKSFVVETDASEYSVGAVLSQKDENGKLHPIQFSSRTMNQDERKYSVCETEAFAGVSVLKKFSVYLLAPGSENPRCSFVKNSSEYLE